MLKKTLRSSNCFSESQHFTSSWNNDV